MNKLLAAYCLTTSIAISGAARAEDITRFAPLKADQLTPAQKEWADMIAAPPRNAKFTGPPYRAYIRNPDLAPRISALEPLAAAAPERTGDPDHRPAVDRAI